MTLDCLCGHHRDQHPVPATLAPAPAPCTNTGCGCTHFESAEGCVPNFLPAAE